MPGAINFDGKGAFSRTNYNEEYKMGSMALRILFAVVLLASSTSYAGPIYDYQGLNFTKMEFGTALSTNNSISGWLEFSVDPEPDSTINTEFFSLPTIIDYAFTEGERILTPDNSFINNANFTFDESLGIVAWYIALLPGSTSSSFMEMANRGNLIGDISRFDGTQASNSDPGTWTKRAVSVPEPATFTLLGVGVVGFTLARRRRRHAII